MLPNEGGGKSTVGPSPLDCMRQFVGRRAFVDPPAWQSSCRDGLLELSMLRVPGTLGVQTGWPDGLAGWLSMCGIVRLSEKVSGMRFLRDLTGLG